MPRSPRSSSRHGRGPHALKNCFFYGHKQGGARGAGAESSKPRRRTAQPESAKANGGDLEEARRPHGFPGLAIKVCDCQAEGFLRYFQRGARAFAPSVPPGRARAPLSSGARGARLGPPPQPARFAARRLALREVNGFGMPVFALASISRPAAAKRGDASSQNPRSFAAPPAPAPNRGAFARLGPWAPWFARASVLLACFRWKRPSSGGRPKQAQGLVLCWVETRTARRCRRVMGRRRFPARGTFAAAVRVPQAFRRARVVARPSARPPLRVC